MIIQHYLTNSNNLLFSSKVEVKKARQDIRDKYHVCLENLYFVELNEWRLGIKYF